MTASKHVKVVVRARPTANFAKNILEVLPQQSSINVHLPRQDEVNPPTSLQQIDWSFKFDSIFQNAKQSAVYEECAYPIVQSFLTGYNGTILAYGQTGAGKTFTMTGISENYDQRGIIPRALHHTFSEIQTQMQNAFTVRISYLEIYNEAVYDLLSPGDDPMEISVVEEKNGCFVKGLTQRIATNEEEALCYLFEGETNRSLGYHSLNLTSSRSHTVFTVYLESKSRLDSSADVIFSKLNLVDLAGSERVAKTNSTGKTLKEATFINKSLSFLEQVILALADKKREHIPYRQSKLTNVLRDSLGGNCNTMMIANIWGEASHIEETVSTLRFATRMMCVTNEPVINVQFDPLTVIKKQEREIRELKQELAMHDTLFGRSHVQYEPFTEIQKTELSKRVKNWLDGMEEEMEIQTLRQIKEVFSIFKQLYHKNAEPTMRLSDSATFTRLNVRSSITSSIEKETELNEEEIDGVGETEGPGFAIGLASNPSSARKRTAKKKSNKKDSASPGIISMTASPLSSSISIPQKTAYVEQEKTTSPLKEGPQPEAITAVDIQQEKNVQALKNGGNSILPPISRKSKPKKNEEFETFKKGPGKELALSLSSAKDVYNSKKKKVLDLASELNAQMKCIRDLHQEISVEVNQAIIEDLRHDPQIHQTLVSESCQENRKHLKSLKQKYKESMENIQKMKSEMEYAKQVVESCRERLLREYDVWYISVYEALDSQHRETGITEDTLLVHSDFTTDLVNEISPSKPKTISKEEDSAYLAYFAALTRNHKRRPGPMKSMI